jgi:hypothetical protein
MSKEAKVAVLPDCDFCKDGTPAQYDARTTFGPWANMCSTHYLIYGPLRLGTGYGQRLVVAS